jgi:hypothetical protein
MWNVWAMGEADRVKVDASGSGCDGHLKQIGLNFFGPRGVGE